MFQRKKPLPREAQPPRCAVGLRDYIVLDLEATGNGAEDAILEISMLRFQDGQLSGRYDSLVNPERSIPNCQIHGIRPRDVSKAPRFADIIAELLDFLGEEPLIIGHNVAGFDVPFLQMHFERVLGATLPCSYIDTLRFAREAFPQLPKHGLAYLTEQFALSGYQAHRAMCDVLATNEILCRCAETGLLPLDFVNKAPFAQPTQQNAPKKSQSQPLAGKRVVFSGRFSRSNDLLAQMAVEAGASLGKHLSSKTNVLVLGTQAEISAAGSAKERKAHALNAARRRRKIRILGEQEFFALLTMNQKA